MQMQQQKNRCWYENVMAKSHFFLHYNKVIDNYATIYIPNNTQIKHSNSLQLLHMIFFSW